jgi:hypothetical protein
MDHAVALVLSGLILVLSHAFDHSFAQRLSSCSLTSSAKERLYAEGSLMAADEIPNTLNGKEKQTTNENELFSLDCLCRLSHAEFY